jgi:hypothetical protein
MAGFSAVVRGFTIISSRLQATKALFVGHTHQASEEDAREAGKDFGRAVATEVLALVHARLTEHEITRLATIAQRKLSGAARYLRNQGYSSKIVRTYGEAAQRSYQVSLSRWERHLIKAASGDPGREV